MTSSAVNVLVIVGRRCERVDPRGADVTRPRELAVPGDARRDAGSAPAALSINHVGREGGGEGLRKGHVAGG